MELLSADWYHQLPPPVQAIFESLHRENYCVYLVGGAVRDFLMKTEPKDFDLVSNAKPDDIEKIFPKTLNIGKSFGISIVIQDASPIEVASFRKDGAYYDARHPDHIEYAGPEEDAKRRDFTMNALFWNPKEKQIIDYVGGLKDIELHMIRTVGDAEKRFSEDALRMLRAFRFLSQLSELGFSLHADIPNAVTKLKASLQKVSRERITQEINLILLSPLPSAALKEIRNTGAWEYVFPEIHLYKEEEANKLFDFCDALAAVKKNGAIEEASALAMLWAAMLETVSKEDRQIFWSRFALPKDIRNMANKLLELLLEFKNFFEKPKHSQKILMNEDSFSHALAYFLTQNAMSEETQAFGEKIIAQHSLWLERETLKPEALLNGDDLLKLGFHPGSRVGEILEKIYNMQLDETFITKEAAIEAAKTFL